MKISKGTFEKEIGICRAQFKKQQGCNWGECKNCGVVLLLDKLYNGNAIEKQSEVQQIKTKHLK